MHTLFSNSRMLALYTQSHNYRNSLTLTHSNFTHLNFTHIQTFKLYSHPSIQTLLTHKHSNFTHTQTSIKTLLTPKHIHCIYPITHTACIHPNTYTAQSLLTHITHTLLAHITHTLRTHIAQTLLKPAHTFHFAHTNSHFSPLPSTQGYMFLLEKIRQFSQNMKFRFIEISRNKRKFSRNMKS